MIITQENNGKVKANYLPNGATYGSCANKYHDILYQNLAPAYLDLRLGRFGDGKSELQTALLIHNQWLNLLKNIKYPAILGIYLKNFGADAVHAQSNTKQIPKRLN